MSLFNLRKAFGIRVLQILPVQTILVTEDSRSLLERDAVFSQFFRAFRASHENIFVYLR